MCGLVQWTAFRSFYVSLFVKIPILLTTYSRFYFVVSTAVYCALGYYHLLTALGVYIDVSTLLYHLYLVSDSKPLGLAPSSTSISIHTHLPFSHSPLHCSSHDAFLPHMGNCDRRNKCRISWFPYVQWEGQIKRQHIRQLLRLGVYHFIQIDGYHLYTIQETTKYRAFLQCRTSWRIVCISFWPLQSSSWARSIVPTSP